MAKIDTILIYRKNKKFNIYTFNLEILITIIMINIFKILVRYFEEL